MTNEEAIVFMDNLMICINEHPVVADWLVEIANRKDEPQTSGKPYKIEASSVCKTEPHADGYMTAKQTEDYNKKNSMSCR